MTPELIQYLSEALTEAEREFAKYSDKWNVDRRDLCAMWRHVITTAPQEIVATAARQIAHYFHPKAELSVPPHLQGEVEIFALGLISDQLFQSYQPTISAYILRRSERIGQKVLSDSNK